MSRPERAPTGLHAFQARIVGHDYPRAAVAQYTVDVRGSRRRSRLARVPAALDPAHAARCCQGGADDECHEPESCRQDSANRRTADGSSSEDAGDEVEGKITTEAIVRTFMTSFVRCPVRDIRMSNEPRSIARVLDRGDDVGEERAECLGRFRARDMVELRTREPSEHLAMGRQVQPQWAMRRRSSQLRKKIVWRCRLTSSPWSSSSMRSTIASIAVSLVSCHSSTRARNEGASSAPSSLPPARESRRGRAPRLCAR